MNTRKTDMTGSPLGVRSLLKRLSSTAFRHKPDLPTTVSDCPPSIVYSLTFTQLSSGVAYRQVFLGYLVWLVTHLRLSGPV